eukprot:TRINITY_DN15354_c0_g1_i1.p1 TRINITY_DN15354_c0_g1~~TRINITY_DN15354_c0_g1_i1.p1  ORF type:complete len:144 (+),score=12.91 TRINITY_DN15354_c0_g1_i1:252-683(+)
MRPQLSAAPTTALISSHLLSHATPSLSTVTMALNVPTAARTVSLALTPAAKQVMEITAAESTGVPAYYLMSACVLLSSVRRPFGEVATPLFLSRPPWLRGDENCAGRALEAGDATAVVSTARRRHEVAPSFGCIHSLRNAAVT